MNEQMKELLDAVKYLRDVVQRMNAERENVSSVYVYGWGGANVELSKTQTAIDTEYMKSMGVESYEARIDGVTVKVVLE